MVHRLRFPVTTFQSRFKRVRTILQRRRQALQTRLPRRLVAHGTKTRGAFHLFSEDQHRCASHLRGWAFENLFFFLKGYFAVRGTRLPPDGGSRVPLTSTIWKSIRKLQIYVEGQWLNVKEMWASCFKSELTVRTNTEAQNKMLKEHYLKCHSGRKSLISLLQMMKTFLSDREKHFSKDNLHFSSGHRVYH